MQFLKITIKNEAKYWWWQTKEHKFPFIISFLISAFFLAVLLFGKQTLNNQTTALYSANGLLMSYMTFVFCGWALIFDFGGDTHEQLDLSVFGAIRLTVIKAAFNTTASYLKVVIIVIILNLVFNLNLSINYLTTFIILFMGIIPLYLFNMSIGCLTGIFKDNKIIAQIIGLLLITYPLLLFLPAYPFNWVSMMPYLSAASTVKLAVTADIEFPAWWYLFLFVQSIVYTVLLYKLAIMLGQIIKRKQ